MLQKRNLVPALLAVAAVVSITFGIVLVLNGPDSVRGQIVSVEQASVTTISRLTIEDDSGARWDFEGAGTFAGFTPSHLEEHRSLREPVTVEYEKTGDGALIIRGLSD